MITASCGEAGLPASFDKMSVEGLTQYPAFSPSKRSHLESFPAATGVSTGSHQMSTKSSSSFHGSIFDASDRACLWQPAAQWADSHHVTSPLIQARQPCGVHESNSNSSSSSSSGCLESAGSGGGGPRPTSCSPLGAAPAAHVAGAAGAGLLPPASFPIHSYNLQQPSVGFYRRKVATPTPGIGQDPNLLQQWAAREQTQHMAKSITKRLSQATHYQQVLDIIHDSLSSFDEVNVATALHRLAKLHSMHASGAAALIVNSPHFKLLMTQIQRLLPCFEAQALSNTAWALATLGHLPPGGLLDALAERAAAVIHTFRPQATSNTLWAFAKLGLSPCEALMIGAARQMREDLGSCVPQDLSNSIWAFTSLRWNPGEELLSGVAQHAVHCMSRFKPQEMANLLWSYATLSVYPGEAMLGAMAIHMSERIQAYRPQAISNSLWAYAKLGYNPGPQLLDLVGARVAQMLAQYSLQELAHTLWALAVFEHHPGAGLLDACAEQISRRIEQFSPQDATWAAWAFARLFHYPEPAFLNAVSLYTLRTWSRFKAGDAAAMLWALAVLKAPSGACWQAILGKLAMAPVNAFVDAELVDVYSAYLLMDQQTKQHGAVAPAAQFPHTLLEAAERCFKETVEAGTLPGKLQREVSSRLWELGIQHSAQHTTSDGLFCVDLALQDSQVVFEIDGPAAFSMNQRLPLGRTVARKCMLENCGYIVRSIPFYQWAALQGPEMQKVYLLGLLRTVERHAYPLQSL